MAAKDQTASETTVREVSFVVDPSSGFLGVQHNVNDEPNRSSITERSFLRDSGFRGILRGVQFGTHKNKPACLIAFDFLFLFNASSLFRFKSAEIIIEFFKTPDKLVVADTTAN